MKRSYFVPDDHEVTPEQTQWAMTEFNITEAEVQRQTEIWRDHEYKRAYMDWNRAWKRWFRQAEKYDALKRERQLRQVEEISEEQRKADAAKAWAEMNRLRGISS